MIVLSQKHEQGLKNAYSGKEKGNVKQVKKECCANTNELLRPPHTPTHRAWSSVKLEQLPQFLHL